ncbi:Aste57867_24606 [Aphanomyces stellatus]|uniref:Aste57867_24606 protein n=1 Tax=Aphanomyces stellatus TaxID=120398 RepID=A0A485LSF8_9STRA|nr:hypothetical protein As57867_024528 [Aphanomyces stellatus]VFU01244.1 Aste57867_24606 [Aphanomyces stellatus]
MGRPDLTNQEREAILREVFLKSPGSYQSRLLKGYGEELATKYKCDVSTIRKVLARAKKQGVADGNMLVSVSNWRKGWKQTFTPQEDSAIHLGKTDIKLATLHRYLKHGKFRTHSSAVRPILTDANKYVHLKFATSTVGCDMVLNEMHDYVHLDEKWFYITKEKRTFYLVPGETEPYRKCKSKRYIIKVMFLSAVARQRYHDARVRVTLCDEGLRAAFTAYEAQVWSFALAPQPPNSSDINILDLGFFAAIQSLQHRSSAKTIDELVGNVQRAFVE